MGQPQPTARELDLLKILWEKGQATVREIFDELHAQNTQLAYTTVLSLLQAMERKGLVRHERCGKAYNYSASVERNSTVRSMAQSFMEKVFDGALDEYLVRAMESKPPSEKELNQIEAMIAEHKKNLKKGKGGGAE